MATLVSELQVQEQRRPGMPAYASYRKLATPSIGKRVVIRFLNGEDREGLSKFLQKVPAEDIQFCKHDIKDQKVVDDWLNPGSPGIISIVASDKATNEIAAILNISKGRQAARNVADIHHIIVAKPLQGLGLGSLMLDESINLASRQRLHWLKAEVAVESKIVLKAFRSRGFEIKATLQDYFIDYKGTTHDVALMMLRLIKDNNEDF
jgi:L-amino acid N-acyltransferase YncA